MIIRKHHPDCSKAKELARYIMWFCTDEQARKTVEVNHKVPLTTRMTGMIQREKLGKSRHAWFHPIR